MAHLGSSIFVVAIDFGTTYSGYAFASRQDVESDPPKISTNVWQGSTLLSLKAPTAVLLDENQELVSFGYEAENRFAELLSDNEHKAHFYFHQFKMLLHNQRVTRTTEIKDFTGKSMQALTVFSLSIRYLKEHLWKKLQRAVKDKIQDEDLYFVLTVPAIWDDPAKQFMREAAEQFWEVFESDRSKSERLKYLFSPPHLKIKWSSPRRGIKQMIPHAGMVYNEAGIQKEKLTIALEPEAASIFCQRLKTDRVEDTTDFTETVHSGMKYMVIDLGGGTADITVHERQFNGTIHEVIPPDGGPWGGKSIDDAFYKFLSGICGGNVMEELKTTELEDYVFLFREFETKKRSIETNQTNKVVITLPVSLTDLVKKKHKKFENAVEASRHKMSVNYGRQKLHISPETFRDLFQPTIDSLIRLIGKLLDNPKLSDLRTILMVGGFSECELIQDAITDKIGTSIKLIIPEEAGLAVLKGAVLFGLQPKIVSRRIARLTYGIQSWPEWDADLHPVTKKVDLNGQKRCKDVFFKYITRGDSIDTGHAVSQIFQALKPEETTLECTVYTSTDTNPRYTTDPTCRRLGILTIQLPPHAPGQTIEIEETLIFGDTEILCRARDIRTGITSEVQFDLL